MEESSWQIGSAVQGIFQYVNSQDNDLAEETGSVLSMAPEEALENQHRGVYNPEEITTDKNEDLSGLEKYIDYVTIRVMTDTSDPKIFKSNSEKMYQAEKDVRTKEDRPKLVVDTSGQYKYKCTETTWGKTYSAMYDAETHIKTKHKRLEIKCINVERTSAKEATW